MQQIYSCLENKQDFIAHAPTGLGKTAALLSAGVTYALRNNLTVFFLTPKHSQHHIAIETLKLLNKKYNLDIRCVDLIGKKHMCLQSGVHDLPNGEFHDYCRELRKRDQCDFYLNMKDKVRRSMCLDNIKGILHVEESNSICKKHEICPFEMAALAGKKAKVIVADYYHILSPSIRGSLLSRLQKNLSECIICFDEAHNLPERCRDLLTTNLSTLTVDRALKENKEFNFDYENNLFDMFNNLSRLAKEIPIEKNESLVKKEDFNVDSGLIEPLKEAADIVREKQKRSSLGVVANFLESWAGPDKAFTRIITREFSKRGRVFYNLSYRCLDPSLLIKQLDAHSLVFMSGTLSPTNMYLDLFGLDKGRTVTTEYSNPFPQKNRLNIIAPTTTTKFTKRDDKMFKRISRICSDIVNVVPGNAALFFPSYSLRDEVNYFFKDEVNKTVISEQPGLSKKEKQELIEKFKSYSKEGAVLLGAASGSFGEGIDLPGDFLNAVVVVGLPLAKPDLETQELIDYYDERFARGWDYGYIYPAIIKALQNAGRCIRTENDKGCIVFLDERYVWDNYKKCFPADANFEITKLPSEMVRKFFREQ